jgi:hypothetical protein
MVTHTNKAKLRTFLLSRLKLPWIPEPSVNNKLKRRELGSGSTGGFFN